MDVPDHESRLWVYVMEIAVSDKTHVHTLRLVPGP